MKNTTFRKKALLSSVAMLLVALVALGSATFAWFTQNPTVNADGLSLKATAAAGLQILSDTEKAKGGDFKASTVINAIKNDQDKIVTDPDGATLSTPVSLDCSVTDSVTFRTTSAELDTYYAKDANAQITTATPDYRETLWLRSSVEGGDKVTIKSASVTFTKATGEANQIATKLYNAIRVTLVDNETSKVIGTWSPDGIANTYLTATGVSTDVYTKAFGQSVLSSTAPESERWSKQVGYDDNCSVDMIVWLDGEDAACYTSNVENMKDLVSTINVKFSTAS